MQSTDLVELNMYANFGAKIFIFRRISQLFSISYQFANLIGNFAPQNHRKDSSGMQNKSISKSHYKNTVEPYKSSSSRIHQVSKVSPAHLPTHMLQDSSASHGRPAPALNCMSCMGPTTTKLVASEGRQTHQCCMPIGECPKKGLP